MSIRVLAKLACFFSSSETYICKCKCINELSFDSFLFNLFSERESTWKHDLFDKIKDEDEKEKPSSTTEN